MFGKLRRTAEMNHEGIGMGLMIVQNLVRLNGGTIGVHSLGEDRGSTFSFSMKMKIDQRHEQRISEKQELEPFKALRNSQTLPIKSVDEPRKEKKYTRRKFKQRMSLNSNHSVSSESNSSLI